MPSTRPGGRPATRPRSLQNRRADRRLGFLSPLGRGLSAAILHAKLRKSHGGKGEGALSSHAPKNPYPRLSARPLPTGERLSVSEELGQGGLERLVCWRHVVEAELVGLDPAKLLVLLPYGAAKPALAGRKRHQAVELWIT